MYICVFLTIIFIDGEEKKLSHFIENFPTILECWPVFVFNLLFRASLTWNNLPHTAYQGLKETTEIQKRYKAADPSKV